MSRRVAGFSLIEVLIALAIAAVGLMAVFDLQRQLIDGQRRYERALATAELGRTSLTFIRELNPTARPTGEVDLPPNITIRWTAEPLGVARRNIGLPAGDGNFMVQLYRVRVEAADRRTGQTKTLTVERVGWQALQTKPVLDF